MSHDEIKSLNVSLDAAIHDGSRFATDEEGGIDRARSVLETGPRGAGGEGRGRGFIRTCKGPPRQLDIWCCVLGSSCILGAASGSKFELLTSESTAGICEGEAVSFSGVGLRGHGGPFAYGGVCGLRVLEDGVDCMELLRAPRRGVQRFVGFRQPHSFNVVKFNSVQKTRVLEACKVSSASQDSATDTFSTGSSLHRTMFCTGWADGARLSDDDRRVCVDVANEWSKKSHVRVWDIAGWFDLNLNDGGAVQIEITDKRVYHIAVAPGGARMAMRM
eukprot:3616159-Rhodomonas_salina.1